MIVSIHQPNYFPWYGFFDKFFKSDVFVIFDDVKVPNGRSYINRTMILIGNGSGWLTVPVIGRSEQPFIHSLKLEFSSDIRRKHLKTIRLNYAKSQYFNEIFTILEELYSKEYKYLIDLNVGFYEKIIQYFKKGPQLQLSSELLGSHDLNGQGHIIELIKAIGGTTYISGSGNGSKRYIVDEDFNRNHIRLIWQDVGEFTYKQFNSREFVKGLSFIDYLFNCGNHLFPLVKPPL